RDMKKSLQVVFIMLLVASVCSVASAKVVLTAIYGISKSEVAYQSHLKVLERFYEQNPDIEIQFDYIAHDTYHTKMQALVVAGALPDILHLWPGKRTGYITDKGMALDLRELMDRDHITATIPAIQKRPQGFNGEIYELGVPSIPYANVVYANDKLMKEVGLTFPKDITEFIAQAKPISDAGYRPLVFGDKSDWVMQSCMLSLLASRVGGLEWFMDAVTGKASFTDQEFVDAIGWIKKMTDGGLISKSEVSTTREQAMGMLINDESVYYINGTWDVGNFVNNASEDVQNNISLHFFPEIPGQKTVTESSATAPPTGFGMNANLEGEKKEAAWKWIQAQVDPSYAELHVAAGSVPLYLNEDISHLFTNDLVKRLYQHLISIQENLYVIDDKLDSEGVNSIVNPGLQEIILGSITPEELAAKYEAWVAENDSNRK
ncbi:MAG: extracellular solute-binding protein, partial [bacterium]|nr:extracellular solute-binding protein [bacterium]